MFEIPDDDDLFSEENFKDILEEVSRGPTEIENITAGAGPTAHLGQPTIRPVAKSIHNADSNLGSPQSKRPRVLADFNSCSNREAAAIEQTQQKDVANHSVAQVYSSSGLSDVPSQTKPLELLHPPAYGETTPVVRRRSLRKFPGPAGILPPVNLSELPSSIRKSLGATPEVSVTDGTHSAESNQEDIPSTQSSGEQFGGAGWQALVSDLGSDAEDALRKFSVRAMLHKASRRLLPKGKVPLLLGVLDSIDFHALDASVVIRDRTGQMQGTLHREVLKDFTADLQVGAAVVLRQVSVISPSPRTHYLNITAGNIVVIYPANGNTALTPTYHPSSSPPEAATTMTARLCSEMIQDYLQAAELELLEAANAAKESALSRLRVKQYPATPVSSSPHANFSHHQGDMGAGGGPRQSSPGLFGGYNPPGFNQGYSTPRANYGTPRANCSTPGTSHNSMRPPSQFTPPGPVSQTRNERFTFKGTPTSASSQRGTAPGIRTPHPQAYAPSPGMRAPGMQSTPNPPASNSAPNVRGLNPGALTPRPSNFGTHTPRMNCSVSNAGIGTTNSGTRGLNTSTSTPTVRTPSMNFAKGNVSGSDRNSPYFGASTPNTSQNSLQSRPDCFRIPVGNNSARPNNSEGSHTVSTRIQPPAFNSGNSNSAGLRISETSSNSNISLGNTCIPTSSGVTVANATSAVACASTPNASSTVTCTDTSHSQAESRSSLAAQQSNSKWSFKHKPAVSHSQSGSASQSVGSASHSQSQSAGFALHSGGAGTSGSGDVRAAESDARPAATTAGVGAQGSGLATMPGNFWDEELSDDILSQLSDDF